MTFTEFKQLCRDKTGINPSPILGISNIGRPMENAIFLGGPNLENAAANKPFAFVSKISISPSAHLYICISFGRTPQELAAAVSKLGTGINNTKFILDQDGLFITTAAAEGGVISFNVSRDQRVKAEAFYYYTQGYDEGIAGLVSWIDKYFEGTVESVGSSPNLTALPFDTFKHPLNSILFGPPGTGKTFHSVYHALAIIKNVSVTSLIDEQKSNRDARKLHKREFDKFVAEGRIVFVTFHQSYSYEEFVEGIKPTMGVGGNLEYSVIPGVFKRLCLNASKAVSSDKLNAKAENFVMIIDEINRGNISRIFGELITLIEDTKRSTQTESLSLQLAYSGTGNKGDLFSVPPNLYLIGTMNSTDRSIALMDTALRRRFTFFEQSCDVTLLSTDIDGIDLRSLLETMNRRIEYLLDKDHLIGHAYLLGIKTKNDVCGAFRNKLLPLLQEYFYNDMDKVRLVLGDNREWKKSETLKIISKKDEYRGRVIFGSEIDGYEDRIIYAIRPDLAEERYDSIPAQVFISIYNSSTDQVLEH
jgi:5-methylcytosine-specific restriction endonuclease McrBC GTP-binding regulatory subunit McrB